MSRRPSRRLGRWAAGVAFALGAWFVVTRGPGHELEVANEDVVPLAMHVALSDGSNVWSGTLQPGERRQLAGFVPRGEAHWVVESQAPDAPKQRASFGYLEPRSRTESCVSVARTQIEAHTCRPVR